MRFAVNMLQTESTRVVSLINCGFSEDKSGKLYMENHLAAAPNYKRRGVSAVRDFPPGCGRAPRILKPNEEAVFVGFGFAEEAFSDVVEPAKALGSETGVVSKDICKADIALTEKLVPQKYPPRTRISAVRDFPPFCGRNAPRLSNEQVAKVHSSLENKSLGQEKSGAMTKPREVMAKAVGVFHIDRDAFESRLLRDVSGSNGDKVQPVLKGTATKGEKNQDEFGASSEKEIRMAEVGRQEREIDYLVGNARNQNAQQSGAVPKSVNMSIVDLGENVGEDFATSMVNESSKRKFSNISASEHQLLKVELLSGGAVVCGLMAKQHCPWKQVKGNNKPDELAAGATERKGKKNNLKLLQHTKSDFKLKKNEIENFGEPRIMMNSSPQGAHRVIDQMDESSMKDYREHDGEHDNFQSVKRSQSVDVSLPPSCPVHPSGNIDDNGASVTRNKVRETMRLFQAVYRKLLQEEEAKLKEHGGRRRIDLQASKILKERGKYVNVGKQIMGSVPGVEVGDEFQYRVELNIIGLHRPIQGGIDYMKQGTKILATSIVSSGGYDDDMDNSDVLIYTGSGGNVINAGKEPEDQKLERGNLALKNSVDAKNPVRVIRGDTKSDSVDSKARTYIYDGLYLVEKYWQERGSHGKLVFKFMLTRIPGQPELAWKVVKKSKKFKVREGLCMDDISQGEEKMPICAVNTGDNENPAPFRYITRMMYPDWYCPIPHEGCDCTDGCSEAGKCSCVAKNGGEIPFNYNGAIVEAKTMVYECGPSCKCPPTCYNRVSQHGIKFQLEIFKTVTRGWGVRSLNSIPSGSFICEYVGELLEEKEAEQRAGNDEYLFDIGNQYIDNSLQGGILPVVPWTQSSSSEVVGSSGFTIDAAQHGNVGRFINHSCSPNLYAQNVLYDHGDERIPHVMLFAVENIRPLEELTYHYNYMMDHVFDSDGNIRKKRCHCGSPECTGRMY